MADRHLLDSLRAIVGRRHVLTRPAVTARFRQGYRVGGGPALAVIRPGSLVELWRAAQACVAADVIIIMQAANTGLTGGSTPDGLYDRPLVIVQTGRIAGLHLADGGRQVICFPGTSLHTLERRLRPSGREPHSVIGSSCLGASVIGGVCNNSGGALVRRGPAYTELALYAQLGTDGQLHLVNHLGIKLPDDPEAALARLERGDFDLDDDPRAASDQEYERHVRDVEADTPARFNADPRRLFEASGSAGRVIVLAVRLDTFEKPSRTATFYIGTNDPGELAALRRRILRHATALPIAGEYLHRGAFDIAERYGKDLMLAVLLLGTDRLPALFTVKAWVDRLAARLPLFGEALSDRLLQRIANWAPRVVPRRAAAYRDRYEHHLLLKVADDNIDETRALLNTVFPSGTGAYFECTPREAERAFLHRFAAAGAAVRYRALKAEAVGELVALDVALPRNERDWHDALPFDGACEVSLFYGHFFCHVFHLDYVLARGTDAEAFHRRVCAALDARGARYPAEHNVGHAYAAPQPLQQFYRKLDPLNQLNPGIGRTSKRRLWA